MIVLLDSNILLPLIDGTGRELPSEIKSCLTDRDTMLFGSVASIWEVAIKHRLGKLVLPCPLEEWPNAFDQLKITPIRVSTAHVIKTVDPWPDSNDPFDRLLLAVCACESMRLLTLDAKLRDHPLAWRP